MGKAGNPLQPIPPLSGNLSAAFEPTAAAFGDHYRWHETLRDGSQVLIRPLRKDDAGLERAFLERLSPESLHYRFLGQVNVTDELVRQLVDVDHRREVAFIAVTEAGEQIGVGRFCASNDGTNCECAVVVSDEWQGKGLGYSLMRHLIDVARQAGMKRMHSIDSAQNHNMRMLATDLGFKRKVDAEFPSEAVFTLEL